MLIRTFDLNLKEENQILFFENDIFFGIKSQNDSNSPILYRWPDTIGQFWGKVKSALTRLLDENPTRFIELMNFSKDEVLKQNCKVVYETFHETISKKYKEIIKITTEKLETLEKITF